MKNALLTLLLEHKSPDSLCQPRLNPLREKDRMNAASARRSDSHPNAFLSSMMIHDSVLLTLRTPECDHLFRVGGQHPMVSANSHPKTKALTSMLSRCLPPTGLRGSTNAVCGTLPPFSLSKHSSRILSSLSMPDQ